MISACRNCGVPCEDVARRDWDAICPSCGKLLWIRAGDKLFCVVTRVTQFGIMVDLGDGVQGMVHISELTDKHIRHPEEVVAGGNVVEAVVLRVDALEKKIGLSLKRHAY
jgi:uncharacterized protein